MTRRLGWLLVFVLVSVGVLPELLWRLTRNFGLWWDPFTVLVVGASMAYAILRRGEVFAFEETGP
jgi:hypothetical protein